MGRHALKITRGGSDFNRRWCVMLSKKKLATHTRLLELFKDFTNPLAGYAKFPGYLYLLHPGSV